MSDKIKNWAVAVIVHVTTKGKHFWQDDTVIRSIYCVTTKAPDAEVAEALAAARCVACSRKDHPDKLCSATVENAKAIEL